MAAAPPGVAVAIASVGSLETAALLPGSVSVNAPVGLLWVVAAAVS
jgi:hypothetical protein